MSSVTPPNQLIDATNIAPGLSITSFLATQSWLSPSHDGSASSSNTAQPCVACAPLFKSTASDESSVAAEFLSALASFRVEESTPLAFANRPSNTATTAPLSPPDDTFVVLFPAVLCITGNRVCFSISPHPQQLAEPSSSSMSTAVAPLCFEVDVAALQGEPVVVVTDNNVMMDLPVPLMTLSLQSARWEQDDHTRVERTGLQVSYTTMCNAVRDARRNYVSAAGRRRGAHTTCASGAERSMWERTIKTRKEHQSTGDDDLGSSLDAFAGAAVALVMPPPFPYYNAAVGDNGRMHERFVACFVGAEVALRDAVHRVDAWVQFASTRPKGSSNDVMPTREALANRREEMRKSYPPR